MNKIYNAAAKDTSPGRSQCGVVEGCPRPTGPETNNKPAHNQHLKAIKTHKTIKNYNNDT